MDILPISNQVRAHEDEQDQPEKLYDGDNSASEGAIFQEPDQETLSCYYHQHLEQTQNATRKSFDAHLGKRHELFTTAAISTSSDHTKIQCERSMQEGFGLLSPKLKSKRRKTDVIEDHGGRIVPSTGRKDRHSKVCTARGTRDRRVRLSPKTAIMFYDVQDRLGYDRPSKAIDWLMQEAKAAIDALDEPPPVAANVAEIHGPSNSKEREMLKTDKCGMIHQKLEHLNVGNSIGLFTEGVAPSSSTHDQFQAYLNDDFNSTMSRSDQAQKDYQEQSLCAPLTIPSEIFGTNSENVMLQRIFSSNYGNAGGAGEDYSSSVNSLPLHFPAPVDIGHGHSHMFSGHRESLQSSYSRITNYSPQFPDHVSFCNEELPNFTAATFKED